MTVRTLSSDFCLHFGGTRTMRSGDILLFLCLGLYLCISGRLVLLWAATEGDAIKNYLTDIVSSWYHRLKSMMEQSYTGKRHCNAILVACVDYMVITHTTASLGNIFYSALMGTLYVVTEWEECIAT